MKIVNIVINDMKYSINKVIKYKYSKNLSEHAQNPGWVLIIGGKRNSYLSFILEFQQRE